MPGFRDLPPEIRQAIANCVVQLLIAEPNVYRLAPYASVSSEWQAVVEQHTFARVRVNLQRMVAFGQVLQNERRRCVRQIDLHVELGPYKNDPCKEKETWEDKTRNNAVFTRTVCGFFDMLHEWEDRDVCPGGIALTFYVSSPSDLRKAAFDVWQRRRWNVEDIGEKRFAESWIDFLGQDDDSSKKSSLLKPVWAVTSFTTDSLNRRAVVPAALSEMVSSLPCLREVALDVIRERKFIARKSVFDELGELVGRWPGSIEAFTIRGNTLCSWRQLPHEAISEGAPGRNFCEGLRAFASQLKHFRVRNIIRIRELFAPVWANGDEDRDPFQAPPPKIPMFHRLETVDIRYSSIHYKVEWYKEIDDLNKHETTLRFRQLISLAAARMAVNMPKLRRMVVNQRPMMWAGKHGMEYTVTDGAATLVWNSTSPFKPWKRVVEAWDTVARNHTGIALTWRVDIEPGWKTDGHAPVIPALSV